MADGLAKAVGRAITLGRCQAARFLILFLNVRARMPAASASQDVDVSARATKKTFDSDDDDA